MAASTEETDTFEDVIDTSGEAENPTDHDEASDEIKAALTNNYVIPSTVDTSRVSEPDATSMADEKHKHACKEDKKSGRFRKFVKKHFLPRKGGPTNVKEIHIVPDGDELKWARRSAGSAASRSSDSTGSSEDDRLEVVHDMAEDLGNDL